MKRLFIALLLLLPALATAAPYTCAEVAYHLVPADPAWAAWGIRTWRVARAVGPAFDAQIDEPADWRSVTFTVDGVRWTFAGPGVPFVYRTGELFAYRFGGGWTVTRAPLDLQGVVAGDYACAPKEAP